MITVLHLTDLHFRKEEKDNPILLKKKEFFRAVNSMLRESDEIFICVTGDIAFSGDEGEYYQALGFFESLKEAIMKESNIKINFLFVPGNHDCDFSDKDNEDFRNTLIEAVRSGKRDNKTIKLINLQENYREFLSMAAERLIENEIKLNNDLFSSVHYSVDEHTLFFNLFNTAWISTLSENPGKMIYPINEELRDYLQDKRGFINISLIHHPLNWLDPDNSNELKELLRKSSDFILSGHEHTPSDTDSLDRVNKNFISFYEGGLFQEKYQPDTSEFNIIQLNIEDKLKKDIKYSWDRSIYKKIYDSDWISLNTNERKANLHFKKTFISFLKEYSVPITHPRTEFNIENLFVFPDVKEIILQGKNSELLALENSFAILENLEPQTHLHFYGDKEAGKTSLAKKFYIELINNERYPLLTSGDQIKSTTHTDIEKFIRNVVDNQYENSTEQYIQLTREERVLIIDDWDKCSLNADTKNKTIKQLAKWFDNIIIFAASSFDDFSNIKLATINEFENKFVYRQYEIEKLGHFKRNELIGKWIQLGQEHTLEAKDFIRKQDEYERALNIIIGKNFVPSYPLTILILLASLETTEPHNMKNSTNGYYYEILIKQTLSKMNVKYSDTHKLYNYLTQLAHEIYNADNQTISLDDWLDFHEYYQTKYDLNDVQLNFSELNQNLIQAKVIKKVSHGFMFSYSYIYYYFVAQYLADTLHEENDISGLSISKLSENLHIETNSNILMFLTHLSKDKKIINQVLDSSREIFKASSLLKIDEDMEAFNKLFSAIPSKITIDDSDVQDNRKDQHIKRDQHERLHNEEDIESMVDEETLKEIQELNRSHRTLEILGLILKNYYGSKTADEKNEIGTEAVSVALRTGSMMIEKLIKEQKNITLFIEHIIRENELGTDEKQVKKLSARILHNLIRRLTLSTIGNVTLKLGSKDLISTFDTVAINRNLPSVKLIQVAIKLEYLKDFPYKEVENLYTELGNNIIGKDILKIIVQRYLYMFPTTLTEKQKICSLVEIQHNTTTLLKQV